MPGAVASPTMESEAPPAALPTEAGALRLWVYLGAIGFGGPAGQIAVMHRELVERRKWLSERRFLRALSFCMALPGPEAMQLISYSGFATFGVRGALAAGTLFVLPGALVMVALSYIYVQYGHVTAVAGVVTGLTIGVVAVVLGAVLRIGSRVLRGAAAWPLGTAAFAAIVAGLPFPAVIAAAALAGVVIGRRRPDWLTPPGGHGEEPGSLPAPAAHNWREFRSRMAVGLTVWLVPLAALVVYGGVLGDLAWFFTVAALITFGGAYAVLPFVASAAVSHFHWLTAGQMVSGLGLGETTPGPLILVNTFVGYIAGQHAGGTGMALAGAVVATYATFAPSLLFIVLGAPLIDRIPDRGWIANALTAVTIAVVGVVAALAVFVGRHVLISDGSPDVFAVALASAAFLVLRFSRLDVVAVIAGCAAAGLVHQLVI
jgi:chromate transporter